MSRGLMYVREWMMKDVKMRWYLEVELHVVLCLAFSESPSNLVHVHCMLQYIALAPLAGKLLPVIRTVRPQT